MSSIRLKENIVERKKKSLLKLGILAAVLLILCLAVYLSVDRGAPVFDFTDAASVYSVSEGESLLVSSFLEGVKATDQVDGDLTDRIAIKSMRQNADSSISVIYCVRDNSGNLTTEERIYNLQVSGGTISASSNDVSAVSASTEPVEDTQTTEEQPSQEPTDTELPSDSTPEPETEPTPEPTPETEPESEPEPASETEPETEPETETVQISEKPVITLSTAEAHIAVGSIFDYAGYIAQMWDDVDDENTLSNNIWIENYEQIDMSRSGSYDLIFHLVDSDGNISDGQPFTLYVEWQ